MRRAGVSPDTGRYNGTSWAGEGEWFHAPRRPGGPPRPGGRRFCYFDGNDAVLVWTHERLGQRTHAETLGTAREGNSNHPALYGWWRFWVHRIGLLQS